MVSRLKKKRSKLAYREARDGYLFIMPWIIGFLAFMLGPIVIATSLAFFKYDLHQATFIGLENYKRMFTQDPLFWKSLKITFTYAGLVVPLGLVVGLGIALLMNQKMRGIMTFRAIYYLPAVVGGAAVALMWKWLFSPRFGLINYFLGKIGISGPTWLASETWALPALIIISIWGIGGTMLIYLAGLQDIPTELFEAATLDEANLLSRFIHITLPMISPIILFNLIIGIINAFQVFTLAYIMTYGGPHYATLFYSLYLYQNALIFGKFGYASAMATILLIIIFALTIFTLKTSSRWVFYRGKK